MIQRSPTLVASEALERMDDRSSRKRRSRPATTPTARTCSAASTPTPSPGIAKAVNQHIKRRRRHVLRAARAPGFQLRLGEGETGIGLIIRGAGAGYYIDVGGSELIIEGEIAFTSGVEISGDSSPMPWAWPTAHPARRSDRLCHRLWAHERVGRAADLPAVAEKIGLCWGLGSDTAKDPGPWEGELRNMWKPTKQEALWFQGGNLQQARHFSLYKALQIKARMEGIPVSVYRADETLHGQLQLSRPARNSPLRPRHSHSRAGRHARRAPAPATGLRRSRRRRKFRAE